MKKDKNYIKIKKYYYKKATNQCRNWNYYWWCGAIQYWIISQGKREAKRIFNRTIISKLISWGTDYLSWIFGTVATFALDYFIIGNAIASFMDTYETYHNNGWLG